MGFTTSGIVLAAENKTQWPLVLVFIGIPVLLLACQFDDYEGSQNETRKP
jgi:glucose uptake protein GlcU